MVCSAYIYKTSRKNSNSYRAPEINQPLTWNMDGTEAQISSSGGKRGGWITFVFITGRSLSLALTHTHWSVLSLSLSYICFLILSIIISRGCVGVDACDWRMVVKLDCISDWGVPCGKHKCRSDFKRSERLQQSISGHWSHCCRLFHKFFLCYLHFSLYLVAGNILTLLHNVCLWLWSIDNFTFKIFLKF